MNTIFVAQTIGQICMTSTSGQRLFNEASLLINQNLELTLDFSEVKFFASPFFNYSIGQLFAIHDAGLLNRLLHLRNLDETGQSIVKAVIENSIAFKESDGAIETLEKILEQQSKN